jgi:hypothetical protein
MLVSRSGIGVRIIGIKVARKQERAGVTYRCREECFLVIYIELPVEIAAIRI